jgi:hypothetical protein
MLCHPRTRFFGLLYKSQAYTRAVLRNGVCSLLNSRIQSNKDIIFSSDSESSETLIPLAHGGSQIPVGSLETFTSTSGLAAKE